MKKAAYFLIIPALILFLAGPTWAEGEIGNEGLKAE